MKKILALLLLVPSVAFGQGWQIGNPVGTPRALPTPGTVMTKANVDVYGNQQVVTVGGGSSGLSQSVIPVSPANGLNGSMEAAVVFAEVGADVVEAGSTTTLINLTAHGLTTQNWLQFRGSTTAAIRGAHIPIKTIVSANQVELAYALPATPAAGDALFVTSPRTLIAGGPADNGSVAGRSLVVSMDSNYQTSATTGILKLEDSAAASGDALVGVAGVANEAGTALAADGDYTVLATTRKGYGQSIPVYDSNVGRGIRAVTAEDETSADAEAINKMGILREDALTLNTGASADWTPPKADALGRTITTLAPAGEMFSNCSASNTGTSDVAIKAAVASNRIYVTSISCGNGSAVASTIGFKDGATLIDYSSLGALAVTGGAFVKSYPVPLRLTTNTALNFAMGTTATSTICCAQGYISVN